MTTFLSLLVVLASAQSYDVYTPSTSARTPVLVFLHGGAWLGGSKAEYKGLAERLTRKNLCVVVVDYRLSHEAKHPQPVLDLEEALRSMKVPERCDTHRLFLVGHSAGAHLIAFWATRNANPDVRGLIGIEGIYDLPLLVKKWPEYADRFVRAEFGGPEKWAAASPARLKLKSKAPWLIIQSAADELVDVGQATTFRAHLKSEGKKVEGLEPKGESHFGVIENLGRTAVVTDRLLEFMATSERL